MDTLLNDLRHGIRQLLRAPGFSLVAILTLALGIGASTAMKTAMNRASASAVAKATAAVRRLNVSMRCRQRRTIDSPRNVR